jgi:hypothetical protein
VVVQGSGRASDAVAALVKKAQKADSNCMFKKKEKKKKRRGKE